MTDIKHAQEPAAGKGQPADARARVVPLGTPAQPRPPFFVVGAQRSGTTMLRLMLNSHPRIAVPFESEFLRPWADIGRYGDLREPASARRLLEALGQDPWTKKGEIIADPEAVLRRPIASYGDLLDAVFRCYAERRGKTRWGVKTPGYVTELDAIHAIFPAGQIIHLVRDGRDVALSYRQISWGTPHVARVADDWRMKVTLGRKMGRMLGSQYMEVRYEDLVRDPAAQLGRICEFIGEPYDPAMLDYHTQGEREMPADSMQWHRNSVSPPDEGKVNAWRREMPLADQIIFQDLAGDALDLFGYERVRDKARVRVLLRRLYYLLVKRW
ncbi:MAG: sulfotransferase [Gammaproteobacteria bacterium]